MSISLCYITCSGLAHIPRTVFLLFINPCSCSAAFNYNSLLDIHIHIILQLLKYYSCHKVLLLSDLLHICNLFILQVTYTTAQIHNHYFMAIMEANPL